MERNACARETGTVAGEFTVAELRPQLLSRALSDSSMGRAGMDTRLVDVRLRLEWARHRVAWNVAADSDRGIYRSRRGNFPGRVLQRHFDYNSASDLGGNTQSRNAATF